MFKVKLNCDLGEGEDLSVDEQIMPYIDMANIACGFHASSPSIMAEVVRLAVKHQVSIGAHPSYPDREGFGRRSMSFSQQEITDMVLYQVGALQMVCQANGAELDFVKPHGALYNAMMTDFDVLKAVLLAVAAVKPNIPLMVLATANTDEINDLAASYDVPLLYEAFADRAYSKDGYLMARDVEGAVYEDVDVVERQVKSLLQRQQLRAFSGEVIPIKADTLCVHGDNSSALASVARVRQMIDSL